MRVNKWKYGRNMAFDLYNDNTEYFSFRYWGDRNHGSHTLWRLGICRFSMQWWSPK